LWSAKASFEIGDQRSNPRKSLFAAAVACHGTARSPIRIRNLSASGALIEGVDLPGVGSEIRLVRASLSAIAEVRWVRGSKAGITFIAGINEREWLNSCSLRGHQERVDDALAAVRSGLADAEQRASLGQVASAGTSPRHLIESLLQIERIVLRATEALAADEIVVKSHGTQLQSLDAAARMTAELVRKI
jgi:hypothetical protein